MLYAVLYTNVWRAWVCATISKSNSKRSNIICTPFESVVFFIIELLTGLDQRAPAILIPIASLYYECRVVLCCALCSVL